MRLRAPPSPMDWRRQQRTVATPPDDPTAWLGGPPSDFLLRHSLLPPRGPPGPLLRAETATASSQTGSAPGDRHPGPAAQPARDPTKNNSSAWFSGPPSDTLLWDHPPSPRESPGRLIRVKKPTASSRTGPDRAERHPGPAPQPASEPTKNDSSAWLGGPPGDFLLRHSLLPP